MPSGPCTTIARTLSRDSTPYEGARRVECCDGSLSSTLAKVPSEAYCPAEAPTCHEASTAADPAFSVPAAWAPAGANAMTPSAATSAAQPPSRLPLISASPLSGAYRPRARARAGSSLGAAPEKQQ